MTAERWAKARSFHHSLFPAERIAAERQQSVSVCLPARECAATVGQIVPTLQQLRGEGVLDEIVVVDAGSVDGTAAVAERLAPILGVSEAEHVLLLSHGGSPLPEGLLEPPVSVNCDSGKLHVVLVLVDVGPGVDLAVRPCIRLPVVVHKARVGGQEIDGLPAPVDARRIGTYGLASPPEVAEDGIDLGLGTPRDVEVHGEVDGGTRGRSEAGCLAPRFPAVIQPGRLTLEGPELRRLPYGHHVDSRSP